MKTLSVILLALASTPYPASKEWKRAQTHSDAHILTFDMLRRDALWVTLLQPEIEHGKQLHR
ncbi:hypothetical protein [Pseudomonas sp. Au-Pse12]|uniref:hypothetical protein n=1 Tax=Pseudomonas sp. Au-Pse12 TaxID=2906459 RepID=UPI001E4F1363|nr:hypothetical protein [Pseudomonas sp. Au-Pse12]MCE4057109.1 hypothetical protein [Pseudomonas sp. Au-Pse12]